MMSKITLSFEIDTIDWHRASIIFERAPLGTRAPDRIRKAFENSQLVCFARDEDTLIGLARALSDHTAWSVIYDLCMLPEYQGQGLGKRMMQAMLKRLDTPNVQLHSVPAMMGFYEKLGFRKMKTAMVLPADPNRLEAGGYIV